MDHADQWDPEVRQAPQACQAGLVTQEETDHKVHLALKVFLVDPVNQVNLEIAEVLGNDFVLAFTSLIL